MRALLTGLAAVLLVLLGPAHVATAQETGGDQGGELDTGADADLSHDTEECLEILEDGGEPEDCQEAPSPILPATDELIWGIISFLVLLFLLWRFAFPPLRKAMTDRTERIRSSVDAAERAKAEAQSVLDQYRAQLDDARSEAGRIIEEARQTADAMRRDLQARAEAEISEMRRRASADVEAAKSQAIADLRAEVSQLAIGAAEVVVQRSLDRETNTALVESFIRQVGASGDGR
ncbi:MAG TPA: F0F1 ATP synthase subunit B [Acidimicrobiales bacterium]|jgi:F-type H+-transporting ATPase subunit b